MEHLTDCLSCRNELALLKQAVTSCVPQVHLPDAVCSKYEPMLKHRFSKVTGTLS